MQIYSLVFAKNLRKLKHFIQITLRSLIIRKTRIKDSQKIIKDIHLSCAETVATPEMQSLPIYSYIRKVIKTEEFSTPQAYNANLSKVIYYTKYNTLFTENRELIVDSVMDSARKDKYSLRLLYLSKPEKISGACTVFRSTFSSGNYYHTLIDHISRLFLIDLPEYREIEEIKLLIPSKLNQVEEYFLGKILTNNIKAEILRDDRIYLIDRLIFPSFITRRNMGYLPSTYLKYFGSKVLPKRPRNKVNRIYISRKLTNIGGKRCLLNEEELIEQIKYFGFKSYSLEDMSIEDQIELFYDANFAIAPHGAGLTNIIFSESINVLEMFAGWNILPYYYYLAKSLGHSYSYWCGKAKDKDSNFRVDVSEILKILQELI